MDSTQNTTMVASATQEPTYNDTNTTVQGTKGKEITVSEYENILMEIMEQPTWRMEADKCAEYFDGNQTDSATLNALAEIGMAPLIENLVAPTVKSIIGLEAKTRKDWKVSAQAYGDYEEVAEALGQKLYEAENATFADKANSDAFKSAVVSGIGWIGVGRNTDPFKYPYRYEYVHRDEMFFDMKYTKPDYSDGQWLLRSKWYDLAVVENAFPQHKDLLHLACGAWNDLAIYLEGDSLPTELQRAVDIQRDFKVEGYEWYNTNRKRLRVNELWYRQYVQGNVIKLPNGVVEEFDSKNEMHMQAAYSGFKVMKASFSKVRVSFWVGMHKLADYANPYKHGEIPYVPMIAYQEDKTRVPYGEVRHMIPMQDEINARNTKMIWLLAAKRITMTEGITDDDPELVRLEAGRPDAMHILNPEAVRLGGMLKIESDFQLSDQQYKSLVDKRNAIKNVSGVYAAFEGSSNQQSGVALHAATEQSSQTLATIYDNFEFARGRAGNMLLSMIIEDIGNNEAVVMVESDYKPAEKVVVNKRNPDGTMSNAVNQARLKVALSDVPSTSTYKQQTLQYMTTLMQGLPPQHQAVMLKFVMRLTDISPADKQEIVEAISRLNGEDVQREPKTPEEAQALQAQRQQAMELAEMQKRAAMAELEEKEAKAAKMKAEAQKALNEAGGSDSDPEKQQLQQQIEQYEQDLIDAKAEFDTKMFEIEQRNKTALEVARINAQSRKEIALLHNQDKALIAQYEQELQEIERLLGIDTSQSSDTDTQPPA